MTNRNECFIACLFQQHKGVKALNFPRQLNLEVRRKVLCDNWGDVWFTSNDRFSGTVYFVYLGFNVTFNALYRSYHDGQLEGQRKPVNWRPWTRNRTPISEVGGESVTTLPLWPLSGSV